ncbi:hypothetical protein L7H89_005643 [Klebsiella pneumoniae]|nr:hypothetical protein [Klebsiella pneumoniae]
MSHIDTALKYLKMVCSLVWKLFLFSKEEITMLVTTYPFKKGMIYRKVTTIITLLFFAYLLGGIVQSYSIQIIFILPLALGLTLTIYAYKGHKERIKYTSDCVLYGLATITSAYLVTNTTSIDLQFFEKQMKGICGFLIVNFFAVAASIRFCISIVDCLEICGLKSKK